jgi:5-hydroxyisourate hydrolase
MSKSVITTHVLDTSIGKPAEGIPIALFQQTDSGWQRLDEAKTDADGRIMSWSVPDDQLPFGVYKLTFTLTDYYGDDSFYPYADIVFHRKDDRHHHIPLLLTPFGYSTYRGS